MTKIIFDLKRDNGYGKMIYLNGVLAFHKVQLDGENQRSSISFNIGSGPIEIEIPAGENGSIWNVTETVGDGFSTARTYGRKVFIPNSEETINFLDLEDVE